MLESLSEVATHSHTNSNPGKDSRTVVKMIRSGKILVSHLYAGRLPKIDLVLHVIDSVWRTSPFCNLSI